MDPDAVDRSNLISYRPLTRADFKANKPPPEAEPHAKELGAMTCAYLLTTPETKFRIVEQREPGGASAFTATLQELTFVAYMDRNCSWWNPAEGKASEAYLLQHEQTHFALTELAARQLNAQVPDMKKQLKAEGDSLEEARRDLEKQLQALLDEAHAELLDVNLEFDEDTSRQRDPVAQQRWADRVQRDLDALSK